MAIAIPREESGNDIADGARDVNGGTLLADCETRPNGQRLGVSDAM